MTETGAHESVSLEQLLRTMLKRGGSDLHIVPGTPPSLRIEGKIESLSMAPFGTLESEQMCFGILNDDQRARFDSNKSINISFGIAGLARFRAWLYRQKGSVCGAFTEIIKDTIAAEKLSLPSTFFEMLDRKSGLLLITGPPGSGKTTVWASAIDFLNTRKSLHIRTIQDPICVLFQHKKSIVTQVEIASDSPSLKQALADCLEHDLDVVGVSDVGSYDALVGCLQLVECGALVIASAQAPSCQSCVNILIDHAPPGRRSAVRNSLARNLAGITCQHLVPKRDGQGRSLAMEMLVGTPDVQQMIRNDTPMLFSLMQSGTDGMQTKDQAILSLYKENAIDYGTAFDLMDDLGPLLKANK
ncbi:Flp pilus assembly complex ATPase component TadA [bacterium]|nr:Flp pilus assembly complex ATPase component TadA [bacterium]